MREERRRPPAEVADGLCCQPTGISPLPSLPPDLPASVTMNSKAKTAPQPPQPPILKVIMVGAGGVGKSALTLQFMYDEVSH